MSNPPSEVDVAAHPFPAVIAVRKLLEQASAFDSMELLSLAGGLQLLPRNSEHIPRLELLALAASVANRASGASPTKHRLAHLLNGNLMSDVRGDEDPFENPFSESVTFHGGSYTLIPGPGGGSVGRLRFLLQALRREFVPPLTEEFRAEAIGTALTGLTISDLVTYRVGITNATPVEDDGSRNVYIPDAERLRTLKRAVVLDRHRLESALERRGLPSTFLGSLSRPFGTFAAEDASLDDNPLLSWPIVSSATHYVVAAPTALVLAVPKAIVRLAREAGLLAALERVYGDVVWHAVRASLGLLQHRLTEIEIPDATGFDKFRWGIFAFDTDKLACVALRAEDLTTEERRSFEPDEQLGRLLAAMESAALRAKPQPTAVHVLALGQPLIRDQGFALSGKLLANAPQLLAAEELEYIALIERGDPLALWKYHRAREAYQKTVTVSPSFFGQLNDFYYYAKKGHHSYYFSDDAPPNMMAFFGGGSGLIRQEVALNEQRHGVSDPSGGAIVEITRGGDAGVYIPRAPRAEAYIVEIGRCAIWFRHGAEDDQSDLEVFAEGLASWFGRMKTSLGPLFGDTRQPSIEVLFEVDGQAIEDTEALLSELVSVSHDGESTVRVRIDRRFQARLFGSTNDAERYLVDEVLKGVFLLVLGGEVASEEREAIINQASRGDRARRITPIDLRRHPGADPRGLPPKRLVQDADEHSMLDRVGVWARQQFALVRGPVAAKDLPALLNGAVAYLYNELRAKVAALSPDGLLEWLVGQNEALVRSETLSQLTRLGRIAWTENSTELAAALKRESSDLAKASITTRFVIEYVAAQPPGGVQPISLAVFDELLALAAGIQMFGTLSDVSRFGIAPVTVMMLGSGRVGVDNDSYAKAFDSYARSQAETLLVSAGNKDSADPPPRVRELIREVIEADLGVPAPQAAALITELNNIDDGLDYAACSFPRHLAQERLSERLHLPITDVDRVLARFSLRPRPDFMQPVPPARREDVYPWRFGRELSLLQRPIAVRITEGVEELVWGPRQLVGGWNYLRGRIERGSLRSSNPKVRAAQGEITQVRGDAFELEAADAVKAWGGPNLKVRSRVRKINGKRLLDAANADLGDIDVLVANPNARRMWLLECKDLSAALTPWQLQQELRDLLGEGAQGDAKSIVERHAARVAWVRSNLTGVLSHLRIEDGRRWEVAGLIVTDHELLAPRLRNSPLKVLPLASLRTFRF